MRRGLRLTAVLVALVLLGTACAKKKTPAAAGNSQNAKFLACMVTDTGGIDDRSFNATAWMGMQNAHKDLGVTAKYLQSTTQNDYAPNINQFIQQKCNIIVTGGFLMGDATKAAASANLN